MVLSCQNVAKARDTARLVARTTEKPDSILTRARVPVAARDFSPEPTFTAGEPVWPSGKALGW